MMNNETRHAQGMGLFFFSLAMQIARIVVGEV